MKKRRIKKIVKSRLQRIKPNGDPEFADEAAQIEALASINKLADGAGLQAQEGAGDGGLLSVLGISNPGAVNEKLDVDLDATDDRLDAFPRDAREIADADHDGIGDNEEIVELHRQLLALALADELNADRATEAAAEVVKTTAQAAIMIAMDGNNGAVDGDDAGASIADFNAAQTAFDTAVGVLNTIRTNAAAKAAEAEAVEAAMAALPQPARDDITFTFGEGEAAVTLNAKTVYDGRGGTLKAVTDLLADIDTAADYDADEDRVANTDQESIANVAPPAAAPEEEEAPEEEAPEEEAPEEEGA